MATYAKLLPVPMINLTDSVRKENIKKNYAKI